MKLRYFYILSVCYILAHIMVSCANRGVGPQGGPKDSIPPVILHEFPASGSVNFSGNTITLQCNEYLQMKDVANQVLISPPQRRTPTVKALGKKVVVTFDEPLRDSTTYVIDFGKAICDLNEGNPLEDYTFAFSTGPVIDTLQIAGVLINAEDLNPVQNMMIGLHSDLRDSAFLRDVFVSIARTDEEGRFTLRNVSPGRYHIYALQDVSKDYVYQPGEGLAFLDTVFSPVAIDSFVWMPDTSKIRPLPLDSAALDSVAIDSVSQLPDVQIDSLSLDSLALLGERVSASADGKGADSLSLDSIQVKCTRYLPDDVMLRFFTEDKRKLYFGRCLREEAHCFKLTFAAPMDSMPHFAGLPPCYLQASPHYDTITVWLPDSSAIRRDTIEFSMTYQYTDSLYNIIWRTDTLNAIYRAPKLSQAQIEAKERAAKAAAKAKKKEPEPKLELKHNASPTFEVFDRLLLRFPLPLRSWPGGSAAPSFPDTLAMDSIDSVYTSTHVQIDSLSSDSVNRALLDHPRRALASDRENEVNKEDSIVAPSIDSPRGAITLFRLTSAASADPEGKPLTDTTELTGFSLQKSDSCASQFAVCYPWEPGEQYLLSIDSAAFTSIYGLSTDRQQLTLKVKPTEDYATLIMKVEPFNERMMVQLLDQKEQVVRTLRADTAGARFEFLKPESYFVRLYEDLNGDSVWTTGDWASHRQPEPVYYFGQKLQLRANWEQEETVLYLDKNILEQKPTEIKKAIDYSKKK